MIYYKRTTSLIKNKSCACERTHSISATGAGDETVKITLTEYWVHFVHFFVVASAGVTFMNWLSIMGNVWTLSHMDHWSEHLDHSWMVEMETRYRLGGTTSPFQPENEFFFKEGRRFVPSPFESTP